MNMQMLYKAPGSHKLHGVMVDYIIVPETMVDESLKAGWHLTPIEADNAVKPKESPVEEQAEKETKRGPGRPRKVSHDNEA